MKRILSTITTAVVMYVSAAIFVPSTSVISLSGASYTVVPAAHAACAGVKTSKALGTTCVGDGTTNPIYALIYLFVKFLSGILGLVLVLVLVIAGIQYIISNGSSDDMKSAKNRIKAAVTAFVLYIIMFAFLQLILPPDAKLFGG